MSHKVAITVTVLSTASEVAARARMPWQTAAVPMAAQPISKTTVTRLEAPEALVAAAAKGRARAAALAQATAAREALAEVADMVKAARALAASAALAVVVAAAKITEASADLAAVVLTMPQVAVVAWVAQSSTTLAAST